MSKLTAKEGQIRGQEAEKRFLEAWANPHLYIPQALGIRKATEAEDREEKTDAVMEFPFGPVRIQIKSNLRLGKKRIREHARLGVVIVRVRPEDSAIKIRKATIIAMRRYIRVAKGLQKAEELMGKQEE